MSAMRTPERITKEELRQAPASLSPAERAGLQHRSIGHADHRHRADLLERREAGIAEAGEHDGILASRVVGEGIDRRMARDRVADPRGDVARPERARHGAQGRALRREGRVLDQPPAQRPRG